MPWFLWCRLQKNLHHPGCDTVSREWPRSPFHTAYVQHDRGSHFKSVAHHQQRWALKAKAVPQRPWSACRERRPRPTHLGGTHTHALEETNRRHVTTCPSSYVTVSTVGADGRQEDGRVNHDNVVPGLRDPAPEQWGPAPRSELRGAEPAGADVV
ncbi:hypothetical protein GW17_00020440 [Ensete ventricosum]|nr:hypothetical protein GW17_00020440 [Ensete ventricosum]